MTTLSSFFYKKSSLTIAFILTIITFGYLFLVMMDAAKCFEVADSAQKSLGTSFGITAEMVQEFFSIRTEEMIVCYKEFNTIWDNLFALFYGLMYIFWLSLLLKPFSNQFKILNLLPLLQVVFDWLENFQVVRIANSFLAEIPVKAFDIQLLSTFSAIKWFGSALVFLLIIIGIVLRIRTMIKKRKLK